MYIENDLGTLRGQAVTTPGGDRYAFFCELLNKPHLLIAGTTGSGKSVFLHTFIHTLMLEHPMDRQMILIDPKRVELIDYADVLHCMAYTDDSEGAIKALTLAVNEMESRYIEMRKERKKKYDGCDIYVIIDEYADLILTSSKRVVPLIQRIAQLGRAARVHIVLATQSPSRKTLDPKITLNITDRFALRCQSAIESKQIIGIKGAEDLPKYGKALYQSPEGYFEIPVPLTDEEERQRIIDYYQYSNYKKPFLFSLTRLAS